MVALAFENGAEYKGWFARAIRWKTGGSYIHAELAFLAANLGPTGSLRLAQCFSSREPYGTSFQTIDLTQEGRWLVVVLSVDAADEAKLLAFCEGVDHKNYDWLGILGFVLPWGEHDDKDRFCSEICTEALQKVLGWFPNQKPWKTSPMDLMRLVTQKESA